MSSAKKLCANTCSHLSSSSRVTIWCPTLRASSRKSLLPTRSSCERRSSVFSIKPRRGLRQGGKNPRLRSEDYQLGRGAADDVFRDRVLLRRSGNMGRGIRGHEAERAEKIKWLS